MRASVPTELHIYPGAPDAFELAAAAKVSPPALRDRFDILSRAFSWSEPEKKSMPRPWMDRKAPRPWNGATKRGKEYVYDTSQLSPEQNSAGKAWIRLCFVRMFFLYPKIAPELLFRLAKALFRQGH